MFAIPNSGIRSAMMRCKAGSFVNHVAMFSPAMKTKEVMKSEMKTPRKSDLLADLLAFAGCPEPSRKAHRTSELSAIASISCSTESQSTPEESRKTKL